MLKNKHIYVGFVRWLSQLETLPHSCMNHQKSSDSDPPRQRMHRNMRTTYYPTLEYPYIAPKFNSSPLKNGGLEDYFPIGTRSLFWGYAICQTSGGHTGIPISICLSQTSHWDHHMWDSLKKVNFTTSGGKFKLKNLRKNKSIRIRNGIEMVSTCINLPLDPKTMKNEGFTPLYGL